MAGTVVNVWMCVRSLHMLRHDIRLGPCVGAGTVVNV